MMLARNSSNMCGIATDATFPIEQITEAIRRSEQSGRNGKVIVNPNL